MTISTTSSTTTALGNGVTTSFNFSFVVDEASDISVIYADTSGIQTLLSPSQYTLFLNPIAVGSLHHVGGNVVYPIIGSPIVNGTSLTITRTVPLTQTTSISSQGDFYPTVVERALDELCLEIQQVSGRTGQILGVWQTGIAYNFGDVVQDGVNGANTLNYYMCQIANVSGVWATDLAAGDWTLALNVQQIEGFAIAAAASAAAASSSASAASSSASSAATSASSAATSASTATTQAGIATTQAANAATSATQAANFAASYSGTSTTSLAIGTGAQVFTTQASKLWVNGQYLQIASNADATNYMHGTVTSYSGTTLTMNITDTGGSGTHADWNISISGTQGPQGAMGGGVTSVAMTGDNVIYNTAVPGSPITNTGTLAPTLKTQSANTILAGPTTGAAATPTVRLLVAADLPAQAANSFLANATTGSASPTAISLAASQLSGRGATGNVAAIALGTGLSMSGATLNATAGITKVVAQNFITSGTYTPTSGMVYCVIEVWGGGGGGGGVSALGGNASGGGAAGGNSKFTVPAATIGASKSVTIGAGGLAGANTGGTGGTGGTTSVGSTIVQATGGTGGIGDTSGNGGQLGGTGGVGSLGDINATGAYGLPSIGGAAQQFSGGGGNTSLGGGGAGFKYTTNANGNNAANNSGSGGGGAGSNAAAHTGGVGGSGFVVITEYCQ